MSHETYHMSCVTCHMSHSMRPMSLVTCHMSCVTCPVSFNCHPIKVTPRGPAHKQTNTRILFVGGHTFNVFIAPFLNYLLSKSKVFLRLEKIKEGGSIHQLPVSNGLLPVSRKQLLVSAVHLTMIIGVLLVSINQLLVSMRQFTVSSGQLPVNIEVLLVSYQLTVSSGQRTVTSENWGSTVGH